jgi:thymidylate synthase
MYAIAAPSYREALYETLGLLRKEGRVIAPRGMATLELEDVCLTISDPRDRVALLPGRRADIFATVAETLWVIAGREDVAFVAHYLPRMHDYSDDGLSLHGAYGPRLRNWRGVDQLQQVRTVLTEDPESRRAAVVLFDPERDLTAPTKDVPCNNWLHFTIRDGRLNLRVASRSMDALWGSTINVFEWTVLQELMALWLGVKLGTYTHFVGSMHLYYGMRERVDEILSHDLQSAEVRHQHWDIKADELDSELSRFFEEESKLRAGEPPRADRIRSEILRTCLALLWARALHRNGDIAEAAGALGQIPPSDLRSAAEDQFQCTGRSKLLVSGRIA